MADGNESLKVKAPPWKLTTAQTVPPNPTMAPHMPWKCLDSLVIGASSIRDKTKKHGVHMWLVYKSFGTQTS